jgi:hypothetical protein
VAPRFLENFWTPQVLGEHVFICWPGEVDIFLVTNTEQDLETKNIITTTNTNTDPYEQIIRQQRSKRRHKLWNISPRKQTHCFRSTTTA